MWGFGIGVFLGLSLYAVAELLPRRCPNSIFGKTRDLLLDNPISIWLQLRDGWGVWADGGREEEWKRWRTEWERQRKLGLKRE